MKNRFDQLPIDIEAEIIKRLDIDSAISFHKTTKKKSRSSYLILLRIKKLHDSAKRLCNGRMSTIPLLHAWIHWSTCFHNNISICYPSDWNVFLRKKFYKVIDATKARKQAIIDFLPSVHTLEEKTEVLRLLTILTNILDKIHIILKCTLI